MLGGGMVSGDVASRWKEERMGFDLLEDPEIRNM